MNWETILETYPTSFEALGQFACVGDDYLRPERETLMMVSPGEGAVYYADRYLYDFFDVMGLCVYIRTDVYMDGINWLWQILWYSQNNEGEVNGTMLYGDNGEYENRKMAEQAAFEKAFELLEERLLGKLTSC